MTKNKPSFQFDNTFSVKKLSDNTPIDTLYSDGGHEKQLYNIGDKIVTQYNDVFKAGLIFTSFFERTTVLCPFLLFRYTGTFIFLNNFSIIEFTSNIFI